MNGLQIKDVDAVNASIRVELRPPAPATQGSIHLQDKRPLTGAEIGDYFLAHIPAGTTLTPAMACSLLRDCLATEMHPKHQANPGKKGIPVIRLAMSRDYQFKE